MMNQSTQQMNGKLLNIEIDVLVEILHKLAIILPIYSSTTDYNSISQSTALHPTVNTGGIPYLILKWKGESRLEEKWENHS